MNFALHSRVQFRGAFWLALGAYALLMFILGGEGDAKFEHLHLQLDTANGLFSLLLALFLLAEQHDLSPRIRNYLVVGFGFAAFTEILHALVGIEWMGSLAWIQTVALTLRPATWPPSTYILPLAIAWALWLKHRNIALPLRHFIVGVAGMTLALLLISWYLPKYVDTGILGIHRPTQIPLLLLWALVIQQCWKIRSEHPLFEGLAWLGGLLFLSDLIMLYSTSPHEKFTMMAHSGKLIAYLLLHYIQMRVAAEDSQAREAAELALAVKAQQLELALTESANLQAALDEHLIIGITDVRGTITHVNALFSKISGYSSAELIGQNHRLINSGKHPTDFFRAMYHDLAAGKVWHGDICNRAKDGSEYWVQTTIVPMLGVNRKPTQYIAMRTEITERKLAEAQLETLALYDNLTGLANRRLLLERLGRSIESSKRHGAFGALLFLDLDHFKPLNDRYGHHVGDLLLQEAGQRIKQSIRVIDTAARFGGDEFVVLLSELSEDKAESAQQASVVAEKLHCCMALPYQFNYKKEDGTSCTVEHHSSASIGVALFCGGAQEVEQIIQMADVAMYQAKVNGANQVHFYQAEQE